MGPANPITPSKVTAAPGRNKSANQHWDCISSWYSISYNSNHSDNGWYLVRTSLCQTPFCFQWIMSLNLPNWGWLIFPFYRRRNRGTQSSNNLPKVTQMVQWNSTCHSHFHQLNWPPGLHRRADKLQPTGQVQSAAQFCTCILVIKNILNSWKNQKKSNLH